jgi:hypothetical protein
MEVTDPQNGRDPNGAGAATLLKTLVFTLEMSDTLMDITTP